MDIPELESELLIVDSCRRLTGPSLVWNHPGAILDVLISDLDKDQVLKCWYRQIEQLLDEIGAVYLLAGLGDPARRPCDAVKSEKITSDPLQDFDQTRGSLIWPG